MRLALGKAPPPLGLDLGAVIHGYSVEGIASRHAGLELVSDAIGPDGEAVSLVVALIPPGDRRGWGEFRRHARLRASLRHPALLPVRAAGELAGRPYLVTDLYPRVTFADLVVGAALKPAEALELLVPVCEALDLAHENGLVHRSLSSTSVLVGDGRLFLDSFGVAGWPARPTIESLDYRDTRYASPEELASWPLERASNIYSLACVLLEAADPDRSSKTRAYVNLLEPSPPAEEEGELSAFDEVIARGVARNPNRRQRTASGLLNEAAAALGVALPRSASVTRPPSIRTELALEEPARHGRRRGIAASVAIVLALATLAGAGAAAILKPLDDGGDAQSASSRAPALRSLADRRAELRDRLAAATTPQEQTAVAARLAGAYRDAARAIDPDPVAATARTAASAYTELALAAESGDEAAFADASRVVGRAERVMSVTWTRSERAPERP
jgi:Protein kinase domain